MIYNAIKHILPVFCFSGVFQRVDEIHSGNINNTYHLYYRAGDGSLEEYALQRINSYVFKDPRAVMRNIDMVSRHLKDSYLSAGVDPSRRMLEIIPARNGDILYEDSQGGFWRAYRYIDHAIAYDRVEKPEHFFQAGRAFGEFQRLLCTFPADQLADTIPDFHNTTKRFYTFVASVASDKAGRVRDLEQEIEFFFDRRRMMSEIVKRTSGGQLPLRVTHNDTKINNVLLDETSGEAMCVIDLDTVMPGSVLYDYGDAIRFGASTAAEDELDTSKVGLNMELFRQFTSGFLAETNGFLSDDEIRLLPLGIKVITCELAMRFLTDYIDGDLYFKIKSPDHNLVRARAQMALLRDVEQKYDALQRYVDDLVAGN